MFLSIKSTILATLVGLQVIAAGIIISSSFVTSETAVLRQAERLMVSISGDTISHTRNFLGEAEQAVNLAQALKEGQVLDPDDSTTLQRFFFEQLKVSDNISGIYFGDTEGQFTFVNRSTIVDGADYQTKSMTTETVGAEFTYRDAAFQQIAVKTDPDDAYDPTKRGWYTEAIERGTATWTAPYIFYTSKQPGVTVAAPVTDPDGEIKGVVGIDIEISAISNFLADLDIGETGTALILATNGDVIAHPDPSKIKKLRENGKDGLRFAKIHEIDDPVAGALVDTMSTKTEPVDFSVNRFVRVTVDDQVYDAVFAPFSINNLDWTIAIYVPETAFLGSIIDARTLNIAIAFSIACLTVFLGWLISRQITVPLTALSRCADQITRGEDADTTSLPQNFVELKHVSTAFSRMTRWLNTYRDQNLKMNAELADSARKLEVRVDDLHAEIADRKRAEAQSQQLQNELAHVTRFSTTGEMAASLAHELNQPLTAITQYCDLLLNTTNIDKSFDEGASEYIEEMQDQAFRAGEIIRELRQFIRKGETDAELVDLRELITQTVRLVDPQARENDIDIVVDVEPTVPEIMINRVQIAQVLVNLLRNSIDAIKSVRSDERNITIKATHGGGRAEITVTDTGPGLVSVDHAFKPFETTKPDGMGMGLSISRSIVEAHHGQLSADPDVKSGARFRISLPDIHDLEASTA